MNNFQYDISRFWEKYCRETVFSTLVWVTTEKNNEKSGFEILKTVFRYLDIFQNNFFFDFNTC